MRKRIVLVGAGHAHLPVLLRAAELIEAGAEVTVIAPEEFWYSGMGPGMVAGCYQPEEDRVEVGRLVRANGARWLPGRVERIDPERGVVITARGEELGYDLLSLNLGSEVPFDRIEGAAERAIPVKPLVNLRKIRERIEAMAGGEERLSVALIGGGHAGCELAAAVASRLKALGRRADVTLVAGGERLMPKDTSRARRLMAQRLQELGVRVVFGYKAKRITDHSVELEDGSVVAARLTILAVGLEPPPLLARSGLQLSQAGWMQTDRALRSLSHPQVFGAGDCIQFSTRHLQRIGVHAVFGAKALRRNLLASIRGERLVAYRPPPFHFVILNLGNGEGLLTSRWFAARGRWAFRLKDWLDRRFMRQFASVDFRR
jgi:NADH dehydrogenase FAD-containing subunit